MLKTTRKVLLPFAAIAAALVYRWLGSHFARDQGSDPGSWLWLLPMFLLPLALGVALAWRRAPQPEIVEESVDVGVPERPPEASAPETRTTQAAPDGTALADFDARLRKRDRRIAQLKRKLNALRSTVREVVPPTVDNDKLSVRLETQEAVIESLEELIAENRGAWSTREITQTEHAERIQDLEAELIASADVIEALEDDVLYWRSLARGEPPEEAANPFEKSAEKATR